jgi:catechol 2,3-dioxygenase-like lactoylglutathione lyase family enzyme
MITGILHTAITVKDMDKTLNFYCYILGAKKIFTIDEPQGCPFAVCVQMKDGSCLEFFYPREEYPLGKELGKNHFCLIVDDIFELEKLLEQNNITITSRPKIARDKNWQLWCIDPNGYEVEFMQMMPGCPQRKGE